MKALILLLLLPACAVGLGKPNEVMMKNEKFIMVKYDKLISGSHEAFAIGEEHCRKYGKAAVMHLENDDIIGIRNVTFYCE